MPSDTQRVVLPRRHALTWMTNGLAVAVVSLPLWWPLFVIPSWAHPALWMTLLIATLIVLAVGVNPSALRGLPRRIRRRPLQFLASPLVWLILALFFGAIVSALRPNYFVVRDLGVYAGFVLVLMLARFGLQPSPTFDAWLPSQR